MSEWKPIESAPRNLHVLTYNAKSNYPHLVEECCWIAECDEDGDWVIMLDGQICEPTHWMPLPPPPLDK